MFSIVVLLVSLLLCVSVNAQVAFDAVSNGKCGGSGSTPFCTSSFTTLTYSHTTGSGSNRAIAVGVCVSGPSATVQPATSSVTYAGVGLVSKKKHGGNYYCELWSLPDGTQPTTGANNVVVVVSASLASFADTITSSALSFTGVDQTTAWTSYNNGNNGNGTSATLTISGSGANDMGMHFECNGTSVSTTVGANETSRFADTADGNGACNTLGSATATGGDTSFSRTTGNDLWIMIGGAFAAVGAGPAPLKRRIIVY